MLRMLLVFLAGVLVGANVVYYLARTQGTGCPAARACPVAASASPSAPPAEGPSSRAGLGRMPVPPPALRRAPGPVAVAPGSGLAIPVAGVRADELVDTYTQSRGGGRLHDAIDIMAPAGTPVVAATDGRVVKLFFSEAGGITLYQFDPAERHVYYYAHLQGYAPGVVEGRVLRRGEVLGYVGSSGNADPASPHLHFAIAELGPDKAWSGGVPVNPYPLLAGRR